VQELVRGDDLGAGRTQTRAGVEGRSPWLQGWSSGRRLGTVGREAQLGAALGIGEVRRSMNARHAECRRAHTCEPGKEAKPSTETPGRTWRAPGYATETKKNLR
jgi:hypothetical protein